VPAKKTEITIGLIGLGETTPENAIALLEDLTGAFDDARFILPVSGEQWSDTLGEIADWIIDQQIPFEAVVTDDSAADRKFKPILAEAEKEHKVARVPHKIVNLLEKAAEPRLVILWDDDDGDCEAAMDKAIEKNIECLDLTNGLDKLEYDADEPEGGGEPEEDAKPAKKSKADDENAEDTSGEQDGVDNPYTRDELEAMDSDALKDIAGEWGLTVPPRSRAKKYIEAILAAQGEAPADEPEDEPEERTSRRKDKDDEPEVSGGSANALGFDAIEGHLAGIHTTLGVLTHEIVHAISRLAAALEHLPSELAAPVSSGPEIDAEGPQDEPQAKAAPRRRIAKK